MAQIESLRVDDAAAIPPVEIISQEATNAGVAKATGLLALGNIGSRVLGMVRDIVLSGLFGASRSTDAYYVATGIVTHGIGLEGARNIHGGENTVVF